MGNAACSDNRFIAVAPKHTFDLPVQNEQRLLLKIGIELYE